MDELPVSARGLVKRYGDVVALAGVDLTVERGDVYGFLGPNGAGKTTALRILLGLIRPNAGEARLFGRDPQSELPHASTASAASSRRRRSTRTSPVARTSSYSQGTTSTADGTGSTR